MPQAVNAHPEQTQTAETKSDTIALWQKSEHGPEAESVQRGDRCRCAKPTDQTALSHNEQSRTGDRQGARD
jgi:hypothetical protein